jgi:hypothetical protein
VPFKDPIKKKEYYVRHKKQYDAEWKRQNRDNWNEYQRNHKKSRTSSFVEQPSFAEVERAIDELKIDNRGTLGFKAVTIFLWGILNETFNTTRIRKYSGYDWKDIRRIISNFRKNKFCDEHGLIWSDSFELPNYEQHPLEFQVQLALIACIGEGTVCRSKERYFNNDQN